MTITNLFPTEVVTVVAKEDMWTGTLYPEEQRHIERAVPRRQREFTAGRQCAKQALKRFGVLNFPLLPDNNRAPIWPPGIIGSISHCEDFCAAAVAHCGVILGIGLDIEKSGQLDKAIIDMVCTKEEKQWCRNTTHPRWSNWEKIIFSAKESVYKCLFPLTRLHLEFTDIELHIDPVALTFDATESPHFHQKIPKNICGRIQLAQHHIYTSATLYQT